MRTLVKYFDSNSGQSDRVGRQPKGILRTLFTVNLAFAVSFLSFGGDFGMGKTSMKVSTGASIVFPGNLKIVNGATLMNNGVVAFSNKKGAELNFGSLLDGSGVYNVLGNADFTINGPSISALNVNSGKTVWVDSNLSIVRQLNLTKGLVDVLESKELRILNSDKDAVVFDQSAKNSSFVTGTIVRNAKPGSSYVFPVGSSTNGYHPFVADEISSAGNIGVSYLPDFNDDWNTKYEQSKNVHLEDFGGWNVKSDNSGTTFLPYLSLYRSAAVTNENFVLFHTADLTNLEKFTVDNNSGINGDKTYLTSKTKYSSGVFAVNTVAVDTNQSEENEIPKIVNFIVTNGSGRTTFEVPGIENYKKTTLYVYNRFGNLIYKSNSYGNDFDTQNLAQGTYFYELTLTTQADTKVIARNFLEIVRRK